MKNPLIRWLLFGIPAVMVMLQAFQREWHVASLKPLDGWMEPADLPHISAATVFSGDFQEGITQHVNLSVGFREWLVRIHHQLDYSLFRVPHARKVVVGKNDVLFEEQYLRAWAGLDLVPEKDIRARASQFRVTAEWLREHHNIRMVILLLPDKATMFPEGIPDSYRQKATGITNYLRYRHHLEKQQVPFIDMNQWFSEMKDTSAFALYPRNGIHWSTYGAWLALDSLTRYLSRSSGKQIAMPRLTGIRPVSRAEGRDNDIGRALNLICTPTDENLGLPAPDWSGFQPNDYRVLFIGDSFYYIWADAGYPGKIFANRDFWYYDHDVCYGTYNTGYRADALDLRSVLPTFDAIVIMQTNAGYGNLGYYFADRVVSNWIMEENQR
jgi:hypothetical protein